MQRLSPDSTQTIFSSITLVQNKRLITTTIVGVFGLHIMVVMGLLNMPTIAIKEAKNMLPLEISFARPPEQLVLIPESIAPKQKLIKSPSELIQPKAITEPTPETPVTTPSKALQKPVIEPFIEPNKLEFKQAVGSIKPHEQKEPVQPLAKSTPQMTDIPATPVPLEPQVTPIKQQPVTKPIDNPVEPEKSVKPKLEPSETVAPYARDEAIAKASAMAEHKRLAEIAEQRELQVKQQAEAAQQTTLAKQKRQDELAAKKALAPETAKADKSEKAEKVAIHNQPVQLGSGEARWKSRPKTNLPSDLTQIVKSENIRSVSVSLKVDNSGHITSVSIARSSGNPQIDNFVKKRLSSASFYPFLRNGAAVSGNLNLTIDL